MDFLIERGRREKIVLVAVNADEKTAEQSLDELALLVDTAGADEVGRLIQRRDEFDPATYIGSGKVDELVGLAHATDCDTVVFDDELTPAQSRRLEKMLGRTAIDRTAVILDIFAQHAHSAEGKAQVELALLRYRIPRIRGQGLTLSQQGGGIGTRGPGETQLEVDRRRLLRRVHKLEADLRKLTQTRDTQRKARRRSHLAQVALVGYTNAGKSRLLNRLTGASVDSQDRLFATVDPTSRKLSLPGGERAVAIDTVGFVRKLPHQLVEAFRSSLEEVSSADLLVHVADVSAPDTDAQIEAVREVLAELGAGEIPEVVALNKIDLVEADRVERFVERYTGSVAISALRGDGVEGLLNSVAARLRSARPVVDLLIPYDRGDVLAALHRDSQVLSEEFTDDGVVVSARVHGVALGFVAQFALGDSRFGVKDTLSQTVDPGPRNEI